MLTQRYTAAEIWGHSVGGFLLHHFEQLALASDVEQARLVGLLVTDRHLALAAAGTAAVRTGAANVIGELVTVPPAGHLRLVASLQVLGTTGSTGTDTGARSATATTPAGGRGLRTLAPLRAVHRP